MKLLISILLTIILIGSVAIGETKPKKIVVSGIVIARDLITPLANTSYHNMSSEVFIVRVDEPKKLAEQSRYIKIHYGRRMSDPYLPSDFFESGKRWRFKVSSDSMCDGTIKEKELARTPGFETEQILLDEVLPCYVLKPKDLKSLNN